ncbi:MAG: hypothetical protein AB7S26_40675 [Sandaracinaceae bacterium]
MRARASLALLAAVLTAAPAYAQSLSDPGWAHFLHPDRQAGEAYLRDGLRVLVMAIERDDPELGDPPRYVHLEQALLRFDHARASLGDDPELLFLIATALTIWERGAADGGTEHRSDEAITAWEELRRAAPEFLPGVVSSQLATLYVRRHELARARAEYEAALERGDERPLMDADRTYPATRAEHILLALYSTRDVDHLCRNLAEVLMLLGELDASIERYREALRLADEPIGRALARWGLALALERHGQSEASRHVAVDAILDDPIAPDPRLAELSRQHGPLAVLHLDHVFFEPTYEIHAYEAVGHEALATMIGRDQAQERRNALRSWRLFLAEGGTSSPYAEVARRHVEALEQDP